MSFEKRTLMNRFAADDPVDVARLDHLEGEGQLGVFLKLKTSQSIARNHKTLDAASRIVECSADRVQAIQPHKAIYRQIACYDARPRSTLLSRRVACRVPVGPAQTRIVAILGGSGFVI